MSSEESGPEEDMFVKPLSWRSDLVKFLAELDEKHRTENSPGFKATKKENRVCPHFYL